MSETQLKAIGNEMASLWTAIGKIESRTKFSNTSLLNNSTAITIQSGVASGDSISITTTALDKIYSSTVSTGAVGLLRVELDAANDGSPVTADMMGFPLLFYF